MQRIPVVISIESDQIERRDNALRFAQNHGIPVGAEKDLHSAGLVLAFAVVETAAADG